MSTVTSPVFTEFFVTNYLLGTLFKFGNTTALSTARRSRPARGGIRAPPCENNRATWNRRLAPVVPSSGKGHVLSGSTRAIRGGSASPHEIPLWDGAAHGTQSAGRARPRTGDVSARV